MIYVYLVYGFAFVGLGCALAAHAAFAPPGVLPRRHVLLVSGFALLHGAGEWMRMAARIEAARGSGGRPLVGLEIASSALLAMSFLVLLQFGVEAVAVTERARRGLRALPVALFVAAVLFALVVARRFGTDPEHPYSVLCVATRYVLGVPSSVIAAVALFQAGASRHRLADGYADEGEALRSRLRRAGVAFGVYAILAGVIVPRANVAPASIVNQEWFVRTTHVPVELVRTICACVIGWFLTKALVIEVVRERARWEERFRTIFARVPMGMAQSDPLTGKIVQANAKMCELTGYATEEIVGHAFTEFTHPDDRARNAEEFARLARGDVDVYTTEKRYLRKDGSDRWVRVTSTLLPDLGEPRRTLATIEDITARKRSEIERDEILAREHAAAERLRVLVEITRTLEKARLDFNHLLEAIPEEVTRQIAESCVLHLVSADGQSLELASCRHVDPQAEQLLRAALRAPVPMGQSVSGRAAATGKTVVIDDVSPAELRELTHPRFHEFNDLFQTRGMICAPFRVSGVVQGTITVCRSAGTREHAAGFTAEDRLMVEELADWVALALDSARLFVREQAARSEAERAQEELELSAELRERLIGIVSHDLRNPLGAVQMAAALLSHAEDLPDHLAKPVLRLGTAADRMRGIIDELLDFTRGRLGGGIHIEPHPTNLGHIVRHVCEELELSHPTQKLRVDVSGRLEGEYDDTRLAQVVSNLVGNALEHSPAEDPVDISVARDGDAARIVLEVRNAGAPIPADLLPHVFDAFRRGIDPPGKPAGLGLGLFIASEVVRAHGGTIGVESTRESGTTFRVVLPAAG